ncbi:hypothetical protein GOP47_0030665, partial [Adiantum capillus-veneris]
TPEECSPLAPILLKTMVHRADRRHPGTQRSGFSSDETHKNKEASNGEDPNDDSCECAGLIFMCDESTKLDCFKYRVFGLSKRKRNLIDIITKGMSLFLFDVKLKVLHGIYAASSEGIFNSEPDAFGGNFPWQVKFHIEKACIPLPEDVFKPAIKDNYFTPRKFKTELTSDQVQKLVKLFSPLPLQSPTLNEPGCHITATEGIETMHTQAHDRHTEGVVPPKTTSSNADGFPRRDPPPQIYYEPTSPLLDGVLCEHCIPDHRTPQTVVKYVPQCIMQGCASHFVSIATRGNRQLYHEAADPIESMVTQACIYGLHALGAHHGHIHYGQPLNPYNEVRAKRCMHASTFAPGVEEDKACVSVNMVPSHTKSCECEQIRLPPNSSHETFWDAHLLEEPSVDNFVACPYAPLPPKAPLQAGVSYGHACQVIGHKRSPQEMYICAHSEA